MSSAALSCDSKRSNHMFNDWMHAYGNKDVINTQKQIEKSDGTYLLCCTHIGIPTTSIHASHVDVLTDLYMF